MAVGEMFSPPRIILCQFRYGQFQKTKIRIIFGHIVIYAHVFVSTGDKDAAFLIDLGLISCLQPSAAFRINVEATSTSIAEIVCNGRTRGLKLSQFTQRDELVGFRISNSESVSRPSPANRNDPSVREV